MYIAHRYISLLQIVYISARSCRLGRSVFPRTDHRDAPSGFDEHATAFLSTDETRPFIKSVLDTRCIQRITPPRRVYSNLSVPLSVSLYPVSPAHNAPRCFFPSWFTLIHYRHVKSLLSRVRIRVSKVCSRNSRLTGPRADQRE